MKTLRSICTPALLVALGCLVAHAETFRYDGMGRLIEIVYPSGAQLAYGYDSNGNRLNTSTGKTKWSNMDTNKNNQISLTELLRMVQLFNADALHCDGAGEDGFAPGGGAQDCTPHSGDYAPQNWVISLSELLRAVQYFNSSGYTWCPAGGSEDGFCPGLS